jgi:hypothetical protein
MKNFLVLCLGLLLVAVSCGPAAEDREAMHRRAKVFQDSIAAVIRASMNEAAAPAPGAVQALPANSVPVAPVMPGNTAAASPTAK